MKHLLKKIIITILQYEARFILWRHKPSIVAITGSVGKTTTKDMTSAVLGSSYRVQANPKSYNSEVGVPLAILGLSTGWGSVIQWSRIVLYGAWKAISLRTYPAWVVLEIGADHPGDISYITGWLRPDIAIITRVAEVPAHLEFFDSREQYREEKAELARAVKSTGTLILNYDDPDVRTMSKYTKAAVLYFGTTTHSHVYGSNISFSYDSTHIPIGVTFKLNTSGSSVPVTINGMLGQHIVYPALAACAVGITQQINVLSISEALASTPLPSGRMRILSGIKQTVILDDTYNSSPTALYHSLETLRSVSTQSRRIAVIGDMRELGDGTQQAHIEAGRQAGNICDVLYAVGEYGGYVAQGAREAKMDTTCIFEFMDSHSAGEHLEHQLKKHDIILIKGSQVIRCENVVKAIMAHPEWARKLLVRQEKEWKS